MRVLVDGARCQGHTLCSLTAPDVFKLREDDGHSYVEREDVPAELEEKVRMAASACPEEAIVVVDE